LGRKPRRKKATRRKGYERSEYIHTSPTAEEELPSRANHSRVCSMLAGGIKDNGKRKEKREIYVLEMAELNNNNTQHNPH
jgi:hypothetical protein